MWRFSLLFIIGRTRHSHCAASNASGLASRSLKLLVWVWLEDGLGQLLPAGSASRNVWCESTSGVVGLNWWERIVGRSIDARRRFFCSVIAWDCGVRYWCVSKCGVMHLGALNLNMIWWIRQDSCRRPWISAKGAVVFVYLFQKAFFVLPCWLSSAPFALILLSFKL